MNLVNLVKRLYDALTGTQGGINSELLKCVVSNLDNEDGKPRLAGSHKIVSVNTCDSGGGAERVAWLIFKALERSGVDSWLVVGNKLSDDPKVMPFYLSPFIDYSPYSDESFQQAISDVKECSRRSGIEDFEFPYSKYLLTITDAKPDLIVCHNLHGGFFDLRVLQQLSAAVPVVLQLHDAWTMTGHCAMTLGCQKWLTGCGDCPDLGIPPAVERDATRYNWLRKRDVFSASRLYLGSPTNWLLDRAFDSVLAPAIIEGRVIPCPVDSQVFCPAPQNAARSELGFSEDVKVLLFVANQARDNRLKDFATVFSAMEHLSGLSNDKIDLLIVGQHGPRSNFDNCSIRFCGYQPPNMVARFMQAADVFVHAAHEENFCLAIAEAMSCGIPVVATEVGGLSEVVLSGRTGLLVKPHDPKAMASAVNSLLISPTLRQQMGKLAAQIARERYSEDVVIRSYLEWFGQILKPQSNARV